MEVVDLMAEAWRRWVHRQAGLPAGTQKLPAGAALVVTLAGERQPAPAIRREQQAAAIPHPGLGIAEVDGVTGVGNQTIRPIERQRGRGVLLGAQVPVAGALPAALEIDPVQGPLAIGTGHGSGDDSGAWSAA